MANTTQRQFDETLAAIAGAIDRFQGSAADAASTMANAVAGTYSQNARVGSMLGEIVARNAEGVALGSLNSPGGNPVAGEIVSRATEGLTTGMLGSAISATQGGGSVAGTILKSAFGLVPLIGGLFGLFGGGEPAEPEPLVRYALPTALDIEAAATGSGLEGMDYDQFGRPRTLGGPSAPAAPRDLNSPAQITINVQALDARSLMDRSSDIAAAVRHAMLNLNSINDVVTDL